MKKLISILLVLTLLFAFASCGNVEAPSGEAPPDYSKIYFEPSNNIDLSELTAINNALTTINDRECILQAFRILKIIDDGDGVTAEISFDADGFEGIDCTRLATELTFSFDKMTEEEIAESLEKISSIQNVTKIKCYFYRNMPIVSDT